MFSWVSKNVNVLRVKYGESCVGWVNKCFVEWVKLGVFCRVSEEVSREVGECVSALCGWVRISLYA